MLTDEPRQQLSPSEKTARFYQLRADLERADTWLQRERIIEDMLDLIREPVIQTLFVEGL